MSDQATQLTRVSDDVQEDSLDLSEFIAKHHVALVVLHGPRRGAEYPLRREKTTGGRSRDATLVFDEETLSRQHGAIVYRGGRFILEDLGSANGCSVNDETVQSMELGHGDRIQMGKVQLQMILEVREPDPSTHVLDAD